MAIFYIDLVNGNDAARATLTVCIASNPSGTTTRITKTAHGLITGAVVTLSAYSAWLNGRWEITKVDDNSFDLNGAVWQTTVDVSGNVVPRGGSSWADAWKTITFGALSTRIQGGDEIRISKTLDPIDIGSATWTNLSANIILSTTGLTENINSCDVAWSNSLGSTVTITAPAVATGGRQGTAFARITLPINETTNKNLAFSTIPLTDFSEYQDISFWLLNNGAVILDNQYQICLCSDISGTTIVDTFNIPSIPVQSATVWRAHTLSRVGGGNLGSSIQSILLKTSSVAPAASGLAINLDNIIATKTNNISLTTLISKNGNAQGGEEGYYGIQSISGTTLILDNLPSTLPSAVKGYFGTTETVTTYIRIPFMALATGGSLCTFQTNGSISGGVINYIAYEFGYDTTGNTQNGETFFRGDRSSIIGLSTQGFSGSSINWCSFSYCTTGINVIGLKNKVLNITNLTNNTTNLATTGFGTIVDNVINCNNGSVGVSFGSGGNILVKYINNNITAGLLFNTAYNNIASGITISNNNTYGGQHVTAGSNNKYYNYTFSNNRLCSILPILDTYLVNCNIQDTVPFVLPTMTTDISMFSFRHNKISGNNYIIKSGGTANWQTITKYSGDPGSWKVDITTSLRNSVLPFRFKIAEFAFNASTEVTIKVWVNKSNATGINTSIHIDENTLFGINSNIIATKSDDTNWEQLVLTFTPSEAGVIPIYSETFYITSIGQAYIGSINITQT